MNQGQSSKHNRTYVTLQDTLNEIKLIGKETEISQINHTISTHGDTNASYIDNMKILKQIDLCFIFHPQKTFKADF